MKRRETRLSLVVSRVLSLSPLDDLKSARVRVFEIFPNFVFFKFFVFWFRFCWVWSFCGFNCSITEFLLCVFVLWFLLVNRGLLSDAILSSGIGFRGLFSRSFLYRVRFICMCLYLYSWLKFTFFSIGAGWGSW